MTRLGQRELQLVRLSRVSLGRSIGLELVWVIICIGPEITTDNGKREKNQMSTRRCSATRSLLLLKVTQWHSGW